MPALEQVSPARLRQAPQSVGHAIQLGALAVCQAASVGEPINGENATVIFEPIASSGCFQPIGQSLLIDQ
jgi:hypothetical protein